MVLNYIWIAFFLLAAVCAIIQCFIGNTGVFADIVGSTFENAKTAFEISIGLTGVLSLWMGIMKIGEKGGMVNLLSKALSPLFTRLFPNIPKGHPATGHIFMNIAANMLGLDNAATPLGLKAMESMQELNEQQNAAFAKKKGLSEAQLAKLNETASNPMIMFLVLNTSGLTIIPVSIMVYRAQLGAAQPTDVFVPILLATFVATLAGIIIVSLYQRINLFHPILLGILGGMCFLVAAMIWGFSQMEKETMDLVSTLIANIILFGIMLLFIIAGMVKKVNVYEAFIEGAKDGFTTAIRVIPYLVAILVAIGVFRASGGMDILIGGINWLVEFCGGNTDFVSALPTALMKPLSGSGARGMMVDTMTTYGADSFAGRLACIFQGSTDTTFYILAVYFGSVGIRHTRHAVTCGLLADLAGILAAIAIAYFFFA
ncbi:MAG: nucleoside recognition domain-containing protein [Bacteroidaceae bacterium]|nr:nucleoside recognition domain-containing protein [Prevotellaceae bacterium]MDY5759404.1 nucleoside recognition domain-containing protein [Bacteroidaceae bacterium]